MNRWFLIGALGVGSVLVMGAQMLTHGPSTARAASQPAAKAAPRLPDAIVPELVSLCGKRTMEVADDGRLLNHFRYQPAHSASLTNAPPTAGGNCQAVHKDVQADFNALLAGARNSLGPGLYAVSCHRSEIYQADLFCGKRSRGIAAEIRAETVAPPGFSEHHSGYAIDFGYAVMPKCNFRNCFGDTRAGRWLAEHAASYGFEMSFPRQNKQGVSSEPWHWRWVGRGVGDADRRAQNTFAAARSRFPSTNPTRMAGRR
jgi:zinc D-Ala-D-Ala carboxypeptidase